MISNVWEEQDFNAKLLDFHEKELGKMALPDWTNIDCPFCNKKLPLRSIRSISMKLNTRNMGDLALEFICDKCSKMDTLYFRKDAKNIAEFVSLLENKSKPQSKAILEEDMYKQKYNNVVENMIGEENDIIQKGNK